MAKKLEFPSVSFTYRSQPTTAPPLLQSSSFNNNATSKAVILTDDDEKEDYTSHKEEDMEYQRIRKKFKAIRKQCQEIQIQYTDEEFPAAESSLHRTEQHTEKFLERIQSVASWQRPENISLTGRGDDKSGSDWALIKNPHPSDINQGQLGNCWFIAALALIAERRELLSKIFISRKFNPVGVYALRLFIDGKWKGVIIDDLFPCNAYDMLVFSKCREKQLWVPLIEKAMSKLHGSYASLQSGHVSDGLNCLTGFVSERIDFENEKDLELLWARLLSFDSSKFLMGAHISTSDESQTKYYKETKGLITNHVYSILRVVCMENNRLVQLRNPWGRFGDWKGDWSDESPLWNEVMSDHLSPHRSKEGVFWMSFQDFIKIFTGMEVCKIREDWKIYTLEGILPPFADPDCQPCFEVVCHESCEVDISLYQGSKRNAREKVEHTDIGLMVFETENGSKKLKLVKPIELTMSEKQRVVSCNLLLPRGSYCLVPFSFGHWSAKETEETFFTFALTIHSSRSLIFSPVVKNNILADAMICCSKYYGDRQGFSVGENIAIVSLSLGYGYCKVLENFSKDKYVELKVECTTDGNYSCTRNALTTKDVLPPQHCQVVQVLTVKDRTKTSSSKYSYEVRVGDSLSHLKLTDRERDHHQPPINERISGLHVPRPCKK